MEIGVFHIDSFQETGVSQVVEFTPALVPFCAALYKKLGDKISMSSFSGDTLARWSLRGKSALITGGTKVGVGQSVHTAASIFIYTTALVSCGASGDVMWTILAAHRACTSDVQRTAVQQ